MDQERQKVNVTETLTPITFEAQSQLTSWGLSDSHVQKLREISFGFRYDLSSVRIQAISKEGGIINGDKIVLPNFHNFTSRGHGQCLDIAVQLLGRLHSSGYVEDLNKFLKWKWKKQISVNLVSGRSRIHFTGEEERHTWLTLSQKGDVKPQNMIALDPSFREISSMRSNGYIATSDDIKFNLRELNYSLAAEVKIGGLEIKGPKGLMNFSHAVVIGSSQDQSLIYSLGFLKEDKRDEILPILWFRPETEGDEKHCAFPHKEDFAWSSNTDEVPTPKTRPEVLIMMKSLSKMKFRNDPEMAKKAMEQKQHLNFGAGI